MTAFLRNEAPRAYARGISGIEGIKMPSIPEIPAQRPFGRIIAARSLKLKPLRSPSHTWLRSGAWLHPRAYARGIRLRFNKNKALFQKDSDNTP